MLREYYACLIGTLNIIFILGAGTDFLTAITYKHVFYAWSIMLIQYDYVICKPISREKKRVFIFTTTVFP